MDDYPWSDGVEFDDLESGDFDSLLPERADLLAGSGDYSGDDVFEHDTGELVWTFDEKGYYAYVLVDGTRADFETAVDRLKSHGRIAVLTAGRSFRNDSNGERHDWYIRVSTVQEDGSHPDIADVREAMESNPETIIADRPDYGSTRSESIPVLPTVPRPAKQKAYTVPRQDHPESPKISRPDTGELHNQLLAERELRRRAERELQSATNELHRFRTGYGKLLNQITANQTEYESELEKINRRVEKLQVASETVSTQAEVNQELKTTVETLRATNESLRAEHKRDQQYFDQLVEDNSRLEGMLGEKNEKLEALHRELDSLTEIATRERFVQSDEPARGDDEPGKTIVDQRTIQAMFPDTEFVNGSIDMMHREISDMSDVMVKLSELNRTGRLIGGKGVKSAPDWFETHLKTGTNIAGRLYYRIRNGEITVLISDKRTQKLDVKRLRKL